MNETISTILTTAINNPECSILTGIVAGAGLIIKYLIFLFIMIMIYNAIQKLAWNPLIEWIHKKIYKKKERK